MKRNERRGEIREIRYDENDDSFNCDERCEMTKMIRDKRWYMTDERWKLRNGREPIDKKKLMRGESQ